MSETRIPHSPTSSSTSRDAIRSLSTAVRACPCSSIVRAMTALPCSFTSGMIRPNRLVGPSPSS